MCYSSDLALDFGWIAYLESRPGFDAVPFLPFLPLPRRVTPLSGAAAFSMLVAAL